MGVGSVRAVGRHRQYYFQFSHSNTQTKTRHLNDSLECLRQMGRRSGLSFFVHLYAACGTLSIVLMCME